GVVIVVPEHAEHRHLDRPERPRQARGLVACPALGQVARQQQHVGILGDATQLGYRCLGARTLVADVQVADRGDPDHESVSRVGCAPTSCTVTSLWTSRSGKPSAMTIAIARCRSAVATVPVTKTRLPTSRTCTPSSFTRESCAKAVRMRSPRYGSC